jgi:hypothetical protein
MPSNIIYFVIVGIALILMLAYTVWLAIATSRNSKHSRNRKSQPNNLGEVIDYTNKGKSNGIRKEAWRNYSRSEAILEQRVGRETAERLILAVFLNNPKKSRQWCADKALYDLDRDLR